VLGEAGGGAADGPETARGLYPGFGKDAEAEKSEEKEGKD